MQHHVGTWLFASLLALAGASVQAQQVARPVIEPAVLSAPASAAATPITVSVAIVDNAGSLIKTSVNLLFIPPGAPAEIIGTLNDEGLNGDALAGDGIFSAQFAPTAYPFNPHGAQPGLIALRVSAAFRGELLRRQSEASRLEVLQPGLPDDIRASNMAYTVWDSSLQHEVICNEVLAMAVPGTSASLLYQAAAAVNGTLVGLLPGADVNTWQMEIACNGAQGVHAAMDRLESLDWLQGANANTVGTTAGVPAPNDPNFGLQYGLDLVQARKAWAITKGANPHQPAAIPGRTIAVIDTGVRYSHPDLRGKVLLGKNYGANPPRPEPWDTDGHGTHVAGIAAALTNNGVGIAGACWDCRILAVKIFEDFKPTTTSLQLAAGIRNAVERNAQIINLSLQNFDRHEDVARQIQGANRAGAVVIAAAGNSNSPLKSYPGGFDDSEVFPHWFGVHTYDTRVVTVGAVDVNRQHGVWGGGGSNYGNWVEVVAPGVQVWSTYQSGYASLSGTSMATPHVAGVAALMSAGRAAFNGNAVRAGLLASAVATGTNDPGGRALRLVDAFGAVFQGLATSCGRCPEAADVSVVGAEVRMGLGIPGPQQPISVHGVAVPLGAPGPNRRYRVAYEADLVSFDAYTPRTDASNGYFDIFSLSVSDQPYFKLNLTDPLTARPGFAPAFTFSGTQRGGDARSGLVQMSQAIPAQAINFLNAVLDTRALPDADRANFSFGSFKIVDITPE